jgi:hypothetical protein
MGIVLPRRVDSVFSDKLLERQRVSAVAGGKLELPGQGVPKLELGNEGKRS